MLFSNYIPELLFEFPETRKFVAVLDALCYDERLIIDKYTRSFNPLLLTDKKWLISRLKEYGFDIPYGLPIEIMQLLLLNVGVVSETRGSLKGVELFCSLITLGEVSVTWDNFYQPSDVLLLDTRLVDTIVGIDTFVVNEDYRPLYLSDRKGFTTTPSSLGIHIKSLYFSGEYPTGTILDYLQKTVPEIIGFNHTLDFNLTTEIGDSRYYHELLNTKFYE